jgi:hypothetical protein
MNDRALKGFQVWVSATDECIDMVQAGPTYEPSVEGQRLAESRAEHERKDSHHRCVEVIQLEESKTPHAIHRWKLTRGGWLRVDVKPKKG